MILKIYYLQVVRLHSKDLVRDDIVGKECPFPVHKVEKILSRDPAKKKLFLLKEVKLQLLKSK